MRNLVNLERFRYVYVAYIVYASVKTMVLAPQLVAAHAAGHGALLDRHLHLLALVEIAAAVGVLLPLLAQAATVLLLGVFAGAALIDIGLGEAPVHLLLYAACALLLLGGPVPDQGVNRGAVAQR
jgi:hypothetical protein